MSDLVVSEHFAMTADGWALHLKRTVSPAHFDREARPVLILPGYGMNSFIFGYHPKGTSMERCLAEGGFEVFSANFRGQGASHPVRTPPSEPSLLRLAELDVATVVAGVLTHSESTATRVSIAGCSLGGSLAYAYMALRRDHQVGALIAMGAPLRWTELPLILRLAFRSRRVAGMLRITGTRRLAEIAFPIASRLPWTLAMYANAGHIDVAALPEMVRTVEDPHPRVNRDIAHWIRERDMVLRGVNVTSALRSVDVPLLVVAANRDGIVPVSAAFSAVEAWGGPVETLRIGTDEDWYAHACMFVGNDSKTHVFDPMVDWLRRHS